MVFLNLLKQNAPHLMFHAFTFPPFIILWRNRPMREVIKFRNLRERDCTTIAERYRVLPPRPSPLFPPRVARLLGNYWVAQQ
jgi:hypothetical protein